jgi:hypothetical protein
MEIVEELAPAARRKSIARYSPKMPSNRFSSDYRVKNGLPALSWLTTSQSLY